MIQKCKACQALHGALARPRFIISPPITIAAEIVEITIPPQSVRTNGIPRTAMLQITLFVHIIIRIAEGNFSSLTDRFINTIDNIIPALVFPLHTTLDLDILSQI